MLRRVFWLRIVLAGKVLPASAASHHLAGIILNKNKIKLVPWAGWSDAGLARQHIFGRIRAIVISSGRDCGETPGTPPHPGHFEDTPLVS